MHYHNAEEEAEDSGVLSTGGYSHWFFGHCHGARLSAKTNVVRVAVVVGHGFGGGGLQHLPYLSENGCPFYHHSPVCGRN